MKRFEDQSFLTKLNFLSASKKRKKERKKERKKKMERQTQNHSDANTTAELLVKT